MRAQLFKINGLVFTSFGDVIIFQSFYSGSTKGIFLTFRTAEA